MQNYQAPTTPKDIKSTCKYFGIKANTNIGQHFLTDPTVLDKMLEAYHGGKSKTVLEVGPGLGILTERLIVAADRVISVELDRTLEPILHALESEHDNLTIIRDDIFNVNLKELGLESGSFSVVANLPYQITSKFLRIMLTTEPYPDRMIVLVQKEVAERIVAKPGKLSILALSVQLFADPSIICSVPASSFSPSPQVESAILVIDGIRCKQLIAKDREKHFFQLVKGGFAQKRKLLRSNIQNIQFNGRRISITVVDKIFSELKIKKTARAQEISLETWLLMLDKLESFVI